LRRGATQIFYLEIQGFSGQGLTTPSTKVEEPLARGTNQEALPFKKGAQGLRPFFVFSPSFTGPRYPKEFTEIPEIRLKTGKELPTYMS